MSSAWYFQNKSFDGIFNRRERGSAVHASHIVPRIVRVDVPSGRENYDRKKIKYGCEPRRKPRFWRNDRRHGGRNWTGRDRKDWRDYRWRIRYRIRHVPALILFAFILLLPSPILLPSSVYFLM